MEIENQIKDYWLNLPGGKIFVRSWHPTGGGASPSETIPILLFHDSLGCVQLWRDFPALLANATGRIVYAYDRLGFGQSDKQELPAKANFIEKEAQVYFPLLLQELGIKECVLFGHSVGGGIAVTCASHFPELCTAVITESAQAFVEDRTLEGIMIAKKNFENPSEFARLQKYHGEKASWVLKVWTDVWLSTEFSSWSLKDELPMVTAPLLAVHGEKDEFGSLKFPEMIVSLTSGFSEKLILSDCGHVPHKEKPSVVLEQTTRFLQLHNQT